VLVQLRLVGRRLHALEVELQVRAKLLPRLLLLLHLALPPDLPLLLGVSGCRVGRC
jgi:hypothetical protein